MNFGHIFLCFIANSVYLRTQKPITCRIMKKFLTLLSLFALATTAHAQLQYANPVINQSLPDPTVIRVGQDFYLYATENIRNTPIYD